MPAGTNLPAPSSDDEVQKVLALQWVFGLNRDEKGTVHNLSDGKRKAIFYYVGHTAVIYDVDTHKQRLLQGHRSPIVCSCMSEDRRFVVTADIGEGSLMIIWDTYTYLPVKCIPLQPEDAVLDMDITADAMYIVTLSKQMPQYISLWEWTAGDEDVADATSSPPPPGGVDSVSSPLGGAESSSAAAATASGSRPKLRAEVTAQDLQTCVRFSVDDRQLVVTNGLKRVVFWSWGEGEWKYYSPPISMRDFRQPVGDFTQSVFIPGSDLAVTATVDGDLCMWAPVKSEKKTKDTDKTALKVVRVHSSAINYLTTVGKYIVSGGVEGFVRFFDIQLRTVAWFEELNGGPIISISFERAATSSYQAKKAITGGGKSDATSSPTAPPAPTPTADNLDTPAAGGDSGGKDASAASFTGKDFDAPDFVASTANAMIIDVIAGSFNTNDVEFQRGRLLVQGQDQPIMCVAAHPFFPRLAVAGYSGNLHLWEYSTRRVLLLSIFKNLLPHCMSFDYKGMYLAVGFTNGMVKVLDANTLEELQSLRSSHDCVLQVAFSHDSSLFAVADAENCVGLFRYTHRAQDPRKPLEWVYIGRNRAHRSPITGIAFGVAPVNDAPRLMSVGEDKRLIEYNLVDSDIENGLRLRSAHKVTQGEIPTAFAWLRGAGVGLDQANAPSTDVLVIATNEYKVKLFSTDNTRQCIQTVLSPTYGGPLNRILVVASSQGMGDAKQQQQYAVYTTHEKVAGLIRLPFDGNPRKAMGLLAHPMEISSAAVSFDGKFLFTAGGRDCCVSQWAISGDDLKVTDGRPVVDHYIDVIEGGKDGDFMKEIIDYFYYAQIRSQGEETTAKRKIEGKIPFTQVPNLMRALGYYPSEKEIQHMTYEVYAKYDRRAALQEIIRGSSSNNSGGGGSSVLSAKNDIYIDFEAFLRLYVNHRPVFGINKKNISDAFTEIGADPASGVIDRDTLFELLMARGEPLHQLEVVACLKSLLGDEVSSVDMLEENITAKAFAENLLGFEDYEELSSAAGMGGGNNNNTSGEGEDTPPGSAEQPLAVNTFH